VKGRSVTWCLRPCLSVIGLSGIDQTQTRHLFELEQSVLLLNLGCSSNAQCNQQLFETFHQEYLYMSCQTSL